MLGLMAGTSANAEIFDYTMSGNTGMTIANVGTLPGQQPFTGDLQINTTTGTGTFTGDGGAIKIAFTGNFAGFMGGASPMNMYSIAIDPSSTISFGGHTYSLVNPDSSHPDMLEFEGSYIKLWAEWSAPGCASCQTLGDINGGISSSSGGTTSGGTTSGGTAVPEPGMVGLIGLGVVAMMLRRRKTAVAFA